MSKFNIESGITKESNSLSGEVLKTLKLMKIDDCVRNLTAKEKSAFTQVAKRNNYHVMTGRQSCGVLYTVWLLANPTSNELLNSNPKRLSNNDLRGGRDFHSDYAPYGVPSGVKCYIDQEFYEEDKMIVDDMKSIFKAMNEEEIYIKNFNNEKEYK